jgi:hypothetical protein
MTIHRGTKGPGGLATSPDYRLWTLGTWIEGAGGEGKRWKLHAVPGMVDQGRIPNRV